MTTSAPMLLRCSECGGFHDRGELTEGLCPVGLFDLAESGGAENVAASLFDPEYGTSWAEAITRTTFEHHGTAVGAQGASLLRIPGYTVGAELARGGMGIVYRARQYAPDREVALKMLLPFSASMPELRERFQLEVRTLSELDHPAILPIYETGYYEALPWFTMKLAVGGSLAARIATYRGLWKETASLVATIADAAHFAHEHGILHRDLKPGNILFDAESRPFVADFGLAKFVSEESDFTRTHRAMGTPRYLAPELAATSARHATIASDVYSLGAILFELLVGRPAFEAEGLPALLGRIVAEEAHFPADVGSGRIPTDLQVIALKCLAKNPLHRYGSARELADELRRYLQGKPIHARPASAPERAWRWAHREPALASALTACVIILVLGAAGVVRQFRETEAARAVAVRKAQEEQQQRARAEAAQGAAERSELVMRQNLYAADVLAAQRAMDQNDLGTARLLLEAHRPRDGQSDLRGFEWRYLWGKARGQSFAALRPAETGVTAVNFSADGTLLALGCWQTFLYKMPQIELLAKVETASIQSMAFIPGTDSIVVGMRGPSDVRRWRPGDVGLPRLFIDPQGRWPNVAVSPRGDVMAIGTDADNSGWPEGSTSLYDASTGALRQALPASGGIVRFSPDGALLATGSWEGRINLWDPSTGVRVRTLLHAPQTVSLAFSPDSQRLVACTYHNGVLLYDLSSGLARPMAAGHTETVWDAEISPDGRSLATCSSDQTVRIWDIESGAQKTEFRGHSYTVWHVAWSPDGKTLVSGGQDGARFWNIQASDSIEQPIEGIVSNNLFSPDGRWVLAYDRDLGVALHEYPSLKKVGWANVTGIPLRFTPDSAEFVMLKQRDHLPAQILRWSVPDLQLRSSIELPNSSEPMSLPELGPDGRLLVAGLAPDQIGYWDLGANAFGGRSAVNIKGVSQLRAVAISSSGRYVARSFHDWPVIYIRDFSKDPPDRKPTTRHRGQVTSLVFSPDERWLISADSDKFIKIWNVETNEETATLLGHRLEVIDVDISPDGRTLASSSEDRTVRLWNLATRREVARFESEALIDRVTFAPDGNALFLTTRATVNRKSMTTAWRAPALIETRERMLPNPSR